MNEPRYTSVAWSCPNGNPECLEHYLGAWSYRAGADDLEELFKLPLLKNETPFPPFIAVMQLVNGIPQEWHIFRRLDKKNVSIYPLWALVRYRRKDLEAMNDE